MNAGKVLFSVHFLDGTFSRENNYDALSLTLHKSDVPIDVISYDVIAMKECWMF